MDPNLSRLARERIGEALAVGRARIFGLGALAALAGLSCQGASLPFIAISPASVEVEPGATVQFTVTTIPGNAAVVWSVEGDPPNGTISSSGLYQAPAVPGAPVTIACQLLADRRARATAIVTFSGVSISPARAIVVLGGSTRFSATVGGSADQSVSWTADNGLMDPDGTYHAPLVSYSPDVRVFARAVATGATGSAAVHLQLPSPILTDISGSSAVGDTVTLWGTSLEHASRVFFPSAGGTEVRVDASTVSPTSVTVKVPVGATSGPLSVEAWTWSFSPVRSNAIAFSREPRIRVRPDRRDLGQGDSTVLRVAWLGAPGPRPLAFSADVGSVTAETYTAPASIASDTFAHVTACITGTTTCHAAVIGLHPFTTAPDPALVAAGGSIALGAFAGGSPMSATWSLLAGGGAVSPGGVYTASALPEDAGVAWLAASASGATAAVPVGVTGSTPGLLARVGDYVDSVPATPVGSDVESLAVVGPRAYGVVTNANVMYGERNYVWIDAFDIADPLHPVWLGAVESTTRPDRLFTAHGRLYAIAERDWSANFKRTLAIYDISYDLPVAIRREEWPSSAGAFEDSAFDGDRLYFFDAPPSGSSAVGLRVYETVSGPFVAERTTSLTLPPDADPTMLRGMTAGGGRAYISYSALPPTYDQRLAVYDLAADPPTLVRDIAGGGFSLAIVGPLLFADQAHATLVYDRMGDELLVRAAFPFGSGVLASDAGRVVLLTHQNGVYVVDVSAPTAPRLTASLFSGLQMGGGGLAGDRLVLGEGMGGLAVYDLAPRGGPIRLGESFVPAGKAAPVYDLSYQSPYLYAVGPGSLGGWLGTYDATSIPPALVDVRALSDPGFALAVTGQTLAVATPGAVELFDLSYPATPMPVTARPIAANCLRAAGSDLYVGAIAGDLVVLDISVPVAPVQRGSVVLGGKPYAIVPVSPGILAVALDASPDGALALVDVSVPATPLVVGSVALGAPAYGVALNGPNAFVATAAGLALVDVSTTATPQFRWHAPLPGYFPFGGQYLPAGAASVAVHDGIVWVGTIDANAIVYGFDARDVAWPRLVSTSALAQQVWGIVAAFAFDNAGHAFVSGGESGARSIEIEVLDVSRPRNVIHTGGAPRQLQWSF